jgi:hypothetical protein
MPRCSLVCGYASLTLVTCAEKALVISTLADRRKPRRRLAGACQQASGCSCQLPACRLGKLPRMHKPSTICHQQAHPPACPLISALHQRSTSPERCGHPSRMQHRLAHTPRRRHTACPRCILRLSSTCCLPARAHRHHQECMGTGRQHGTHRRMAMLLARIIARGRQGDQGTGMRMLHTRCAAQAGVGMHGAAARRLQVIVRFILRCCAGCGFGQCSHAG